MLASLLFAPCSALHSSLSLSLSQSVPCLSFLVNCLAALFDVRRSEPVISVVQMSVQRLNVAQCLASAKRRGAKRAKSFRRQRQQRVPTADRCTTLHASAAAAAASRDP